MVALLLSSAPCHHNRDRERFFASVVHVPPTPRYRSTPESTRGKCKLILQSLRGIPLSHLDRERHLFPIPRVSGCRPDPYVTRELAVLREDGCRMAPTRMDMKEVSAKNAGTNNLLQLFLQLLFDAMKYDDVSHGKPPCTENQARDYNSSISVRISQTPRAAIIPPPRILCARPRRPDKKTRERAVMSRTQNLWPQFSPSQIL